ncbi:hypothetical protein [Modestobacter altitudinis]|uniref:hypothetical protein n=1 Tax=Modestobacter altitudinis TaxID=2213158 RepID=UPI00110D0A78|nr:hypothetical protein [Modestobacter altitudinis]
MRLVRVAAAAVMGVAVLAGCSGGETANETLPSASISAAETTATLPPLGPPDLPMPDEAREQTPAAAKAFLGYYVSLMNRSTVNLSTDALRELSPNCRTCLQYADGIDDVAHSGQVIEGADFVLNGSSDPVLTSVTAEFSMSLTQKPSRLLLQDGSALPGYDQEGVTYPGSGALLTWEPALVSWQMSDLTFQ